MSDLLYILNVVLPVFLLVLIGLFLRNRKLINESFVDSTSKFVFNVSLPALIFLKLYDIDLSSEFDIPFILFIVISTLLLFVVSWIVAIYAVKNISDRGVFIQGAFRSNYAIVGLAIIFGMFGSESVAKASLVLSFVLPLYNLLSVVALTLYNTEKSIINIRSILKGIILNPLIIAVIVSIPFAMFKLELYPAVKTTGEYLSSIALPLALIGIGGSMNLNALKKASKISIYSSLIKIVFAPLIVTLGAYLLGFRYADLGIIFVIFACPTAIASFVMTIAMGGNGRIAGNIIVISTLGSILTYTIGLYLMRFLHLI